MQLVGEGGPSSDSGGGFYGRLPHAESGGPGVELGGVCRAQQAACPGDSPKQNFLTLRGMMQRVGSQDPDESPRGEQTPSWGALWGEVSFLFLSGHVSYLTARDAEPRAGPGPDTLRSVLWLAP